MRRWAKPGSEEGRHTLGLGRERGIPVRPRWPAGPATGEDTPTQVGTADDWAAIACGYAHSLALKKDGTLWAWGMQLVRRARPWRYHHPAYSHPGRQAHDWAAIAGGNLYSLALKTDGSLWAWGDNIFGELGLGTSDNNAHPTPVRVGDASDWAAVACGLSTAWP